ncbi:hypothetical protein P153DRAFT_412635 [Dothidotthia symphoricarpi CBS 119687]|uniref:Uncharacterized protein n=1 Tax=Dothidotthia symphoricarpi CBS 119687 TaxID=1392245 RepID=A0A6A5ZV70_9PLEO|nr:uncharacterized protein P153DRAFT_412635 [Dothidotthia symphoricarpi CBS 119687]KAF2123612.1 hypothetical protein P153DRAFT_412635 [Dothidotthia symphoricarpi CBS 119687]
MVFPSPPSSHQRQSAGRRLLLLQLIQGAWPSHCLDVRTARRPEPPDYSHQSFLPCRVARPRLATARRHGHFRARNGTCSHHSSHYLRWLRKGSCTRDCTVGCLLITLSPAP